MDLSRPLDLVVLALKSNALRCRVLGTEREITLRTAVRTRCRARSSRSSPTGSGPTPGTRTCRARCRAAGSTCAALGLAPLGLEPEGDWDPEEEYWGEEGEPLDEWAKPIVARGKRPAFEMEQVLPGADPDDWDTDPIIEASELNAAGDRAAAPRAPHEGARRGPALPRRPRPPRQLRLRPQTPSRRCATTGSASGIGALTLGTDFDGVLPWGLIDNRPFLRCLHGLGLCFWRLGDLEEAAKTFTRMLWLNPSDNQGARFNLANVQAGRTWEECEERGA